MKGFEPIKPDEYSPAERAEHFEQAAEASGESEAIFGTEASSEELAGYLLTQLSAPFDSQEPGASLEEHDKNQRFHLELAEDLLPKVNDEGVKEQLRDAIERAKRTH